ncbi:MAG: hypothetical protein AAF205_05305 [Pseudomonadota bacterium]
MTDREDELRHELGNLRAKIDGLERLLDKASDHIRELLDATPGDGRRKAARAFAERMDDLHDRNEAHERARGELATHELLKDKRIVVVEDEVYPGMSIKVILLAAGAQEVRICDGLAAGQAVIAGDFGPDAVVLDLNIGGKDARPLARELVERRIPFVFHTGTIDPKVLAEQFPDQRILAKPAPAEVLCRALADAIAARRGDGAV